MSDELLPEMDHTRTPQGTPAAAVRARTQDGVAIEPQWPTVARVARLRQGLALVQVAAIFACIPLTGFHKASWIVAGVMSAAAVTRDPLRLHLSVLSESTYLVRRLGTAAALTIPIIAVSQHPAELSDQLGLSVVMVLGARTLAYAWIRHLRRHRNLLEPTLVVGNCETTRTFVDTLDRHPEYGLWVVGTIDDGSPIEGAIEPHEPVGALDDLALLVEALDVRRVVIGPGVRPGFDRGVAVRQAQQGGDDRPQGGVTVHLLPRFADLVPAFADPSYDLVHGFPVYRVPPAQPSGVRWVLKRTFDFVAATLLVLLLSPVLLIAAIGVRMSSPGPTLFRQQRVGRRGLPFTMYKFRSFPAEHVDRHFSVAHDDCPLRWGRFLRRTSIDELPNLFNVLRGEMSLVGPRPERPHFAAPLADRIEGYTERHRVPGGITGLAQVHGLWGDTSIEERVRLDNRYIESWTFWADLVILAKTLPAVLRKYGS